MDTTAARPSRPAQTVLSLVDVCVRDQSKMVPYLCVVPLQMLLHPSLTVRHIPGVARSAQSLHDAPRSCKGHGKPGKSEELTQPGLA